MTSQEINQEQIEGETQNNQENNNQSKEKDKDDVYFLILNQSEAKIDFQNMKFVAGISPSIVYTNNIDKGKGTQLEEIVFKFRKKKKKKVEEEKKNEEKKNGEKEYTIKFISGNHSYKISFDTKKKSFIYSPDFKTGNIYLTNIPEEPIEQDIVPLYNKFDIFLDALEKEGKNDKKEKLFEDSIGIYEKKKKFSLLATIFLKIYKNNKVLCTNLIKIFNTINEKENKDRDKELNKYLKDFTDIYSKSQEIVEENKYEPIHFYGVLFCYLHYYDKNNFSKIMKKFWEGNADTLYEILIQYYSHFMNPLNQNKEFYDKFIIYILKEKKDIKIFERVMDYIEDIESFLYVINKNKEKIFEKYEKLNSEPIKIGANLKLIKYTHDKTGNLGEKKENSDDEYEDSNEGNTERIDRLQAIENECDNIIKLIEDLIEFSKKQKTLAIYMKSTFWINLIKKYDIPNWENINNLHKLRDTYKKYNNLINLLYDEKAEGAKKNKKSSKFTIKSDINRYYERDEFAHLLNKNIKDFFQKDKEKEKDRLTNAEILATVEQFNPYFSVRDKSDKERFKNNRETYIFDYINFNKIDSYFIEVFQTLNFEVMFEEIIGDYINKITGKIEDLQTFGNVMKLIKVERIKPDKQIDYFRILKDKYKYIVEDKIKLIKGETELKEAVKIISEFVSKLFLYEKNNGFLDEKIRKLDDKIKSLIYIELITSPVYNNEKYKEQKNHIYDIYLKNIDIKEGRENIIKLVNKLKGEEKIFFIEEKLLQKCEFNKDEFFSNQENFKIKTLIELKKELEKSSQNEDDDKNEINPLNLPSIAEKGNEAAINIMNTLDDIIQDLDKGKIIKKNLEIFLKIKRPKSHLKSQQDKTNESRDINTNSKEKEKNNQELENKEKENENEKYEEEVKEKLGLISLVLKYSPVEKYSEYKKIIIEINKKVVKLIFIKDSLLIFHKNKFIKDIQSITSIINDIENSPIINFKNEEKKKEIDAFLIKHDTLCQQINQVKDFLLFKKIFENAQGKDQLERFEYANRKLISLKASFEKNKSDIETIFTDKDYKNIFNDIKEELSKKEFKSELFISQMIDYFEIKDNSVIEDLKMLIKSKKYENIIKSINYFFKNFKNKEIMISKKKNNNKNDFNLSGEKLSNLKNILHELKDIYDYEDTNPYYKVFTSFYEKKEAIDFLIKYINIDKEKLRMKLKKNLDPTNRSISIKDINDTIECLTHFKKLIDKDTKDIINYLKLLTPMQIKNFESFSKKYGSIIELDSKTGKDKFEEVYEIINDASLLFNLDNENFIYTICRETKIIKNIEELIKLKSKINLQPKKKEEDKDKDDPYEIKCDKLLFFKDIVSNLEIIYDKINILRVKGFNIPIVINVKLQYQKDPKVLYILNNKEKKFNEIKDYLVKIKNDYENQLSNVYETKKYLRLLYGKLFRKIRQHQEGNLEIYEIKRYILNKTSTFDKVEEAKDINNIAIAEDEQEYRDNTKDIFESISDYLIDLFNTNGINFDKHYEKMKINKENIKGISIYQCTEKSMEEYILNLFNDYLDQLPIAQNVLICSKETSIEEMQSFLYRAILCEYNTLFVIEILKSFSNYQHNKMYGYIDKLLSIKLEKFKRINEDKKEVDKEKAKIYMDSYIVFVYQQLDNESAFQQELGKYRKEQQTKNVKNQSFVNNEEKNEDEEEKKLGDLNISNISKNSIASIHENKLLNNIKVITSDVCGLGKSFKIKKLIKESKKKYYHFPLGGKLTKNEIFKKIDSLFKKIKNDEKEKSEKSKDKEKIDIKEQEEYSVFNNVAIHFDLTETKEISLINEFLFSFLITKFYTDNENIIYFPNNIEIYVEVPNSSENYLQKFGILNAFVIENIKLGELLPLELESNIREIFKKLNGIEENEDIEKFIKEKFIEIGIKEYSYHQVQAFIKLYISQFDSKGEDIKITKECIDYFVNSSKYFINGGFTKLIMKKIDKNDKKNKDNTDELQTAYENDLSKTKFDDPLIYIDEKTKKFKLEKLPDINKEEDKGIKIIENPKIDVDIVYLIDATGSMGFEINAAKENVVEIFGQLKKNYKDYDFRFGSVFYRDKIDKPNDKKEEPEFFEFTDDMEGLKEKISKVKAYGGGDGPEDWVVGYDLALNKMKWRNGIKLIIHIADAGAHGKEFSEGDKHEDQGPLLPPKIEECVKQNINIIGFKISNYPKKSFDKISEIYNDFKMKNGDNGQFIEIYDFVRGNQDAVSKNFNKFVMDAAHKVINPSYKYLKRLKEVLQLENDLEKDINGKKSLTFILSEGTDNYVITDDNYKKMVLLFYRIKANVPVIIMGETGCGKTSLIIKLSQILSNGKKLVEIINIHPGITDEEIITNIKLMNDKAKNIEYRENGLWVFFDEINTCLSSSLLIEIFINRTFNGEKLADNIRLIGACNPYRNRKENIERFGLTREDDEDDRLVYKVEKLPQSLLNYVFSFGSLGDEDEKKYIKSIIQKLFSEEEENLRDLTTKAISLCHIFLRESFGNDPSIVSLREIARFTKCVEFFQDYFPKKNNIDKHSIDDETRKMYKIKSIICSIYLCYYIRLTKEKTRGNFENRLQKTLLQIANVYCPESNEVQTGNLLSKIRYQKLSLDLREKNIISFSDLLKIEEEYLLEQIELDKGIGKNQLLKENLFLLFLAVVTKIPLIIVGKPGTGKSLSAQLIYNSMRGKYSKPKDGKKSFFINYPQINQIYFQGSDSSTPDDIVELFKKADDLYKNYIDNNKQNGDLVPIYMILFDELGLAEKAPTNPLKALHSRLEYDGKTEGTCFIGISNYSLDAAKINRALNLSVPNLEEKLDQLKSTAKSIVGSISDDNSYQDSLIFNILSRAYYEYKRLLIFIKKLIVLNQYSDIKGKSILSSKSFGEIERDIDFIKLFKKDKKIKTEFHGNRDFYNLIKGVAIEASKLNNISDQTQIEPIINNFIERNFGGIIYEIDIDFTFEPEDIKDNMERLKNEILNEKLGEISTNKKGKRGQNKEKKTEKKDIIIPVSSVFLFKKIFNLACNLEKNDTNNADIYQIVKDDLVKYSLNKCINDNINDNNSRYLLLEIRSNLAPLIIQNIRIQNSDREGIDNINGSPFINDNNNDYKTRKINEIQNWASQNDKLIILQNLDQIQPYLYDLYNMNYKVIDDQKFVRICLDNFNEQLTPVNDTFKIIVLVDNKFVNKTDMAFLNRLEKMQISFRDLLDNEQNELIKNIQVEIGLKESINREKKKFNYDLNNLLINCNEQDIGGLAYYLFSEAKKEKINDVNDIKEKIYNKMSILLPEELVLVLDPTNPLKNKYFEKKKYFNFSQYMKDLKANDKDLANFKISIIYTFSNIVNTIKEINNEQEFMISEINKEENLKYKIDDIKIKNKGENNRFILIRFEDLNSNKIQFTADFINNYCKEDEYHYIFIIYIKRHFNSEKDEIQRIYSIPNIYNNINQLFIDNLEGSELTLKSLLDKTVKSIMLTEEAFADLDKEFKKSLTDFVYDKIPEKNKFELNQNSQMSELSFYLTKKYGGQNNKDTKDAFEKYNEEITNYMIYADEEFKNAIISKAKELIESDEGIEGDCYSLIIRMLQENYMNKKKIDIISSITDYIKENVLIKYLKYIFNALEDNNILTTLIELDKQKSIKLIKNDTSSIPNNSIIIKDIQTKFLKEIKYDDKKIYEPKFLSHYIIPGFYNFYKKLSDYLNKEIANEYLNNENSLRKLELNDKKLNLAKKIKIFHDKEEELLQKVIKEVGNDKLYYDLIDRVTPDLILKDYITYYLEKYLGINSKSYYKIMDLLLYHRFSERTNIIINNENNPINIILIKIMWIESNINYIESILKAFENGKDIINDQEGYDFYQMIFSIINEPDIPIKYIANKTRGEHVREINECFYLFLAGLCLSVTTNDIQDMEISLGDYCGILKEINKILKNLDSDLKTNLSELYVIDELIQIIEYNPNVNKKIIEGIRNYLTENSKTLQKIDSNKNNILIKNFKDMNESLTNIKVEQSINKYYETLKYIYKQEIQKVDDNIYRQAILEEIIKEKEIFKKSNDIFQILLDSYMENLEEAKEKLLNNEDNIISFLDKNLNDDSTNYYSPLSETLIYFFEMNSIIYLKQSSNLEDEKDEEDDEGLKVWTVFKECNKFLCDFNSISDGNIYITKLFCISYIKSYCYTFIKMHDKKEFNPEKIIEKINKYDKTNMVKLYIYKIIFNKKNRKINAFLDSSIIKKYKLDKYHGFDKFINQEEIKQLEQINYGNESSTNKDIYKNLEKFRNAKFEKEIKMNDITKEEDINFDDFYMAAYKLILSNLNNEEFEDDTSYINFYKNVCEPLYKDNTILISLMKYIFDKESYLKIKKDYEINSEDIEALLYGYRYCLNEILEGEGDYIFSYLYKRNNRDYDKKFYPGNDNKNEPYYELYNNIVNHFKEKSTEGCFVCLCDKGYYHSVKSGFPGFSELRMKCGRCQKDIGAKEIAIENIDEKGEKKYTISYETISSNPNYYRIFKDNEEIKKLKLNKDNYKKFEKLKYMTLEEFKHKYIDPLYSKEKGLNTIDKATFKKENKVIRNLSQISYRLLNYILYCHLFFAKLFIKSERYDKYLPEGVTWFNMIKECFNKLKVQLEDIGIKNVEIFMNCVFKDLFEKLHEKECINKFEELIKFEDELEKLIREKCEVVKKEINKCEELERNSYKNEKSAIVLLKELYNKDKYNTNEYPFYEHFYYSDYLDENYINKILKGRDENEYPVLNKYLKNKKPKKSKDKEMNKDLYPLENLNDFNKGLNLFYDKYSDNISREESERQILKNSDIYFDINNKKIIDDFIKLFNSFELKDIEGNILKLTVENKISDFLIIDDNKYGQSYKKIYKEFIKKQNKELEDLFNKKINLGEFNINCKNKINVQQIKENEIFSLHKNSSFIKTLFNSSYRKYIDTLKYSNYNEFEIDLKQLEVEMTNSFLKNKKLLNDNLIGFNFDNEVFSVELNDAISNFNYGEKIGINIDDKVIIYNFVNQNPGNNSKYKDIINNFITLIKYLNKMKNEKDNKINEFTEIFNIEIVKNLKNITSDFKEIFADKNKENNNANSNLKVNKLISIFEYYLKLIFKYVKKDIEKHIEKKTKHETEKGTNYYLDEKLNNSLEEILKTNKIIQKDDLTTAIRLFITLVLYREKDNDKDTKIRANKKNIAEYLKSKDLWDSSKYNNTARFEEDLLKIKELNLKIKDILYLYYDLMGNKDEDYVVEVEKYIKQLKDKEEEEKRKKKKEEDELESDIDSDFENSKKKKKKKKNNNSDSESSEGDSGDDGDDAKDDDEDEDDDDDDKNKKKKINKKHKHKKNNSDSDTD